MGAESSSFSDLSSNQYLKEFVSGKSLSPNDPFWNKLLSFSFVAPSNSVDYRLLSESSCELIKSLIENSVKSGNFLSLLLVFLRRSDELKCSAQTEDTIFTWQTYNALFMIRTILTHYIESLSEEQIVKRFQSAIGTKPEDIVNILDAFISSLVEIIVDVPLVNFTYLLKLEAVNMVIVLLSIQMFVPKPVTKSTIFRFVMQGKCSIHAFLLIKTLLQHYESQDKAPKSYLYPHNKGLVMGIASSLWNILTLRLGQVSEVDVKPCESPLAQQCLLLILILANHYTTENACNPYRQALFSFSDSEDSSQVTPLKSIATFKLNYDKVFATVCHTLGDDSSTLLLYLLVHQNSHFKSYILNTRELEQMVIPILRILYLAHEKSSHHIYMSLIILLILSEDDHFNKELHKIMLGNVTWYTERSISSISLGGLLILVVIRTIQYNMLKIRDKYLHTNCLAALANMSSHFKNLHPYVSQRLVSLFELLSKNHSRLVDQVEQSGELGVCKNEDHVPSEAMEDLGIMEEVLRMVLEIINSILTHQLAANPNFIYTLLYKKDIFENYRNHATFQDVVQNIDAIISFFSYRLEKSDKDLSVSDVMEIIVQGAEEWPTHRMKKFPDLKFKYVEETQPEEFFVPYVWSLVHQLSNLYWNTTHIVLFNVESRDN